MFFGKGANFINILVNPIGLAALGLYRLCGLVVHRVWYYLETVCRNQGAKLRGCSSHVRW